MREIRFRGKRIDNGEWLYGHLHTIDTLGKGYTGKAIQVQHWKERPFSVQVHPETVGQYTGRITYDETLIYRGDKLQFVTFNHDGTDNGIQTGYVEWDDEAAAYVVVDEKDSDKEYWLYLVLANDDGVRVIGNRWDQEGRVET
ncbi:hypothetical protein PA598K_01428 [Paenibacillus sp. 598K]|uniref:YopX family protein n=1 Tax=Paenibacillus sp. 598K TaxID=1117987 RepID=UPI000FFA1E6B|nr:YopX family protein [Paenibacillus sp. 598K]GBF73143.1 hypothetical protein PA598K_01428 [Paenibacillus sp. 598K]